MCSKIVEVDDMFGNFVKFEKFPKNFRDIVQKFNIIQYHYGSILSLGAAGRGGGAAPGERHGHGRGRRANPSPRPYPIPNPNLSPNSIPIPDPNPNPSPSPTLRPRPNPKQAAAGALGRAARARWVVVTCGAAGATLWRAGDHWEAAGEARA